MAGLTWQLAPFVIPDGQARAAELIHVAEKEGGEGDLCQDCPPGNEYDNLYLVAIYGQGKAKVINLQYGAQSPPPSNP